MLESNSNSIIKKLIKLSLKAKLLIANLNNNEKYVTFISFKIIIKLII